LRENTVGRSRVAGLDAQLVVARLFSFDVTTEPVEAQLILHEYRVERRQAEERAKDKDERQNAHETDGQTRWCVCFSLRDREVLFDFFDPLDRRRAVAQPVVDETGELGIDLARHRPR